MRRIIGYVLSMLGWSEVRKPYLPVCEVARPTLPMEVIPPPLPFWYSEKHTRLREMEKCFVTEQEIRRRVNLLVLPLRRAGVIHV